MWKSIRQELSVQRSMVSGCLAIEAGGWCIGVIIMLTALALLKGDINNYFCIGTFMSLFIGVLMSGIMGAMVVYWGFDDAIHMGKTRKRFLPSVAVVFLVTNYVLFLLAALLLKAEYGIYEALYPNLNREAGPENFMTMPWLLCYTAAVTGLTCGFGAALKKSRKIGGMLSAALWIFFCWALPGMFGEENGNVISRFGFFLGSWYRSLSMGIRMGILAALGIAGYLIMYLLLRKSASD